MRTLKVDGEAPTGFAESLGAHAVFERLRCEILSIPIDESSLKRTPFAAAR
jgi:hypothetical protein